jgi:hypothetical protein
MVMARDILGEFGPERSTGSREYCGGVKPGDEKPLKYDPPSGPKGQSHNSPGLGGTNHGNTGTQGKR